MAGVAQLWLTEDELDLLVKATVRYVPRELEPGVRDWAAEDTRRALLAKLRPLAYGTSCDVSSGGGCSLELETRRRAFNLGRTEEEHE